MRIQHELILIMMTLSDPRESFQLPKPAVGENTANIAHESINNLCKLSRSLLYKQRDCSISMAVMQALNSKRT